MSATVSLALAASERARANHSYIWGSMSMAAAPESVQSVDWGLLTPAFVFVFFCLPLVVAAILSLLMPILGRCVGIEFMFDAPQEERARVQAQNRGEAAVKKKVD